MASNVAGRLERFGSAAWPAVKVAMKLFGLFRFRLRTLILLVTLLAIGLGYHAHLMDQQRNAVAAITELGGSVKYYSPLPAIIVELVGIERIGYVNRVRLRQPFVHLAVRNLQSLPALQSLEIACLVGERRHIEGSLFDRVIREDLPGVSVSFVNEDWLFLSVPKVVHDALPERMDARGYRWPHFSRTDAVQTKDGTTRFVLWDQATGNDLAGNDYAVAVLMDHERVLDWKATVQSSLGGFLEGILEDVDGDDHLDVSFRIRVGESTLNSGKDGEYGSLDGRKWMGAYSVYSDRLVSVFSED
jgi:hypothetical protein